MIARRPPPRDAIVLAVCAAVLALLALSGCASGRLPIPAERPELPRGGWLGFGGTPAPGPLAETVEQLRERERHQEAELEATRTARRSAEQEAREAPLRGLFRWASWIGGALVLAGVVAAVLVRGLWPLWGSAAGAALVVVALTGAALLPYAVPVGIAGAVALVAALAWWGRRRLLAGDGAISVAEALKGKLRELGVSDDERRELQRKAAGAAAPLIDGARKRLGMRR